MGRTELLQAVRMMRFEDAYEGRQKRSLTQAEAAGLLGVCERTFRRCINRYEDTGLEGLMDWRLNQASHRRAPVDEVMRMLDQYRSRQPRLVRLHLHALQDLGLDRVPYVL